MKKPSRSRRRVIERAIAAFRPLNDDDVLQVLRHLVQARPTSYTRKYFGVVDKEHVLAAEIPHFTGKVHLDWWNFQIYSFLRKYPFSGDEEARAERALAGALKAEEACRASNARLVSFFSGHEPPKEVSDVQRVLLLARRKIHMLLDDASFSVDAWLSRCRFGPGVVTQCHGTSDIDKFRSVRTVTPELYSLVGALRSSMAPSWDDSFCRTSDGSAWVVVPGGTHRTVPKDAKIDRNIEVQPLMNAFLQSGLGQLLRGPLRRVGIDLSSQARNQELSRLASLSPLMATIDLSAASDSICRVLVEFLLPSDWLTAMNLVRTHRWNVNGEDIPLERFSSMGNGFTFELECLIFWALTTASCEVSGSKGEVAIYGDDIIAPVSCCDLLFRVFDLVGFTVNKDKTYTAGPFRESCGANWIEGNSITPYRLTSRVETLPDLVSLCNGLFRAAGHLYNGLWRYRFILKECYRLQRRIPLTVRAGLATGSEGTDAILLRMSDRAGLFLHFKPSTSGDVNWFPGRAAALYRLWIRRGEVSTPEYIPDPMEHLYREDNFSRVMNYWRDRGEWSVTSQA